MCANKVSSCSTKNWIHIQLEKKEKEGRVLKYFQVENCVMSFMELRGRRWKYFRHKFLLKIMWLTYVYPLDY